MSKPFRRRLSKGSHSTTAFSLVEVVMALGILSLAILPMIAMIPLGLVSFHDSQEISLSSQARQQILSDLQQGNITTLLNGNASYSETNYFDDEGILLGKATPTVTSTFDSTPVYQVAVTVSTTNFVANGPITLPQADTSIPATNLVDAVLVSTQFSHYGGTTNSVNAGGSTFRTGTDYLYYLPPAP